MEEGPKLLLSCSFSSLESFTSLLRETPREQGNKVLFTELAQENPIDLGLQGAAGPLPEREERCPGDSVSDPAKTLFSCFSCVAAGDTRKTGRER